MRLINNQQVPWPLGSLMGVRGAAVGNELLQYVRLAQVVIGGDDSGQCTPRVGFQAHIFLKLVGGRLVDDVKAEGKLVLHLLLPLRAQRCWREDQHTPDATFAHQLRQNQSRLDRFAKPHVVSQQE